MATIIKDPSGGAECRICGLHFVPDSDDDRQQHKEEHQRLIRGGLPLDVREFMKTFGWAVAHKDGGLERARQRLAEEDSDTGKRAVLFSWWSRARANGIGDEHFESFMAANLAFIDANVAHDEQKYREASVAIKAFEKYA